MSQLKLILLVAALICEGLAAAGVPARVNLTALGLAFWFLMLLVAP